MQPANVGRTHRRVAKLQTVGVSLCTPETLCCASSQEVHRQWLVSEPCCSSATTTCDDESAIEVSSAASSKTADMVEPSVSMMSAFLPKAALLVGLSFAGFYSQQYLKVLGGNLPVRDQMSFRPEHKEAERRRFLNMVRMPTCRLC